MVCARAVCLNTREQQAGLRSGESPPGRVLRLDASEFLSRYLDDDGSVEIEDVDVHELQHLMVYHCFDISSPDVTVPPRKLGAAFHLQVRLAVSWGSLMDPVVQMAKVFRL